MKKLINKFIGHAKAAVCPKAKKSIFKKALISFLVISIIPQFVVAFILYEFLRGMIKDEINVRLKNVSSSTMEKVNDSIANHKANVISWANVTIPKIGLYFNRPEGVKNYFNTLIDNYKSYDLITLTDAKGILFSSSDKSRDGSYIDSSTIIGRDVSGEAWFKEAISKQYHVGDWAYLPLVEAVYHKRMPGIQISSTLYSLEGELIGVISAFVSWSNIQSIVDDVQDVYFKPKINSGYAYLVKSDGDTVIAHPDSSLYGKSIIHDLSLNGLSEGLNAHNTVVGYNYMGQNRTATCIQSPGDSSTGSLNWFLCSSAGKDDLYASIGTLKIILIIVVSITTVVALLFSMRFSKRIVEPILKLKEKTRKISEGNYVPDEPIVTNDEIEDLDKSFNTMVENLAKYQEKAENNAKLAAIGQSASMIAHDIRKPFSTMKSVLDYFEEFQKNPAELKQAKLSINRSIENVERMITDIMDFSRGVMLEVKPESVVRVLDFTVRQTAQSFQDINIDFKYKIANTFKPLVDDDRLSRALGNIISNGIEAICHIGKKDRGVVDIQVLDNKANGNNSVIIVIGNDGPPFNEEDIPNLFESFFTKGKKKGTGLGLASTHKIITLHSGLISARNRINGKGVEFEIVLPASDERESGNAAILPANINETQFVKAGRDSSELNRIIDALAGSGKSYKVVLLEDEALYRASVRNAIKKSDKLHNTLSLYEAVTVDEALALVKEENIEFAIVDIDLGEMKNGFDFLAVAREKYPELKCMVHSNRCIKEDIERTMELGAKEYVPKPLNLEHLVMFLSDKDIKAEEKPRSNFQKVILYADDEELMRIGMRSLIRSTGANSEFHSFSTGEDLFEQLKLLGKCDIIITDQNMGKGMSGLELVQHIRRSNTPCKVYVVSNEPKATFEKLALEAGANGYFNAPIDKFELETMLA